MIALVVTIVVLLILAGVTIALVMNNNGVINQAQEAKNATALSNFKEKLNLANLDAFEEKTIKGSLTIDEYFNILKQHSIISDTNIPGNNINEPYINEDGNTVYEVDSDDGFTFDVVVDKDGNITTENIRPSKDAEKPRIRKIEVINKGTNSIEVKVTVAKLEDGKLSYYYKKDGEPDSSYKELKANTTELTATYTGLEQNVTYNLKVAVKNSKGSHELVINSMTGKLPTGAITQKGTTIWDETTHTASIELETKETGYTIQYQINVTTGTWKKYTGAITGLHHEDKVYAVLSDGSNISGETIVTILDGEKPTVTVNKGTVDTSSIQVNVISKDGQSGIPESPTYSYYIKKSTEETYPPSANYTGANASHTFTGLVQNTSYDVKVTVADKANNLGTGTLANIKTTTVGGATGDLTTGNVTAGPVSWNPSTHKASVTLSTSTSLTIQYKIGASGTWTPATGSSSTAGKAVTVSNLSHNNLVYARLIDTAGNYGDEAFLTILDGIAPTVTVNKGATTTSTIQVSVTSKDDQSGKPTNPTYSYYIKKSTENDYTSAPHTGTETSYTFTGLTQNTSYDVKVTTNDNANNTGTGTATAIKTTTVGGATGDLTTGNVTAGPVSWDQSTHKASVTLNTSTNLTIQYKIGANGTWTPAAGSSSTAGKAVTVSNLSHNNLVYARLIDTAGNYGSEAFLTILDGIAPTVTVNKGTTTTSTIQVSVTSKDDQSGMIASPTYSYYIKKSTEGSYPASASYTGTNTSHIFTGLVQNTSYDVKVTVADKANNLGTGTLTNIKTTTVGGATGDLTTGNVTAGPVSWNSSTHKASVTLNTSTNLTIQYKIGASGTWTPATGSSSTAGKAVTVSNLSHNNLVYARLIDTAGNYGSEAFLTILDGTAPAIPSINLTSTSVNTGATLRATVTHTDNQSGVNTANSKYIWNTTRGTIGTTNASWNNASSFASNPQTITLSTTNPGTYYLHVLTTDNGGNKSESVSSAITIKQLVTGITLNKTNATMTEGETLQLTATINPGNASNKTLKWTSSNQTYATVGTNGLVTAKVAGNVTITVATQDGSGKSATCNISIQSAGTSADDVAKAPTTYYGKEVTGYTCTNSAACKWKIFYAGSDFSTDGKNHIYLIADDYIHYNYCPPSANNPIDKNSDYKLSMGYVIVDYLDGSINITNANIKKLNNSYFSQNFTSTNDNMKAVAYMCDTNVWRVYKGTKADYAVGGPSVEMLMKSYSQKHNVNYQARAANATGYMISKDGGSNWANLYTGMLNTSDPMYVITSTSKAKAYWLASPAHHDYDRLMNVTRERHCGDIIL